MQCIDTSIRGNPESVEKNKRGRAGEPESAPSTLHVPDQSLSHTPVHASTMMIGSEHTPDKEYKNFLLWWDAETPESGREG